MLLAARMLHSAECRAHTTLHDHISNNSRACDDDRAESGIAQPDRPRSMRGDGETMHVP